VSHDGERGATLTRPGRAARATADGARIIKSPHDIYAAKGASGELLDQVVATITANRDRWLSTMMDEELHLQPVQTPDIFRSAIVITIATLVGHLIPLFPFIWAPRSTALILAIVFSAPGAVRGRCRRGGDAGQGLAEERPADGRDRPRRRRDRLRDRPPVPHRQLGTGGEHVPSRLAGPVGRAGSSLARMTS
jgi:VIT family